MGSELEGVLVEPSSSYSLHAALASVSTRTLNQLRCGLTRTAASSGPSRRFSCPPQRRYILHSSQSIRSSHISRVFRLCFTSPSGAYSHAEILRRDDLQELLTDPVYFQAILRGLPRVKAMFQAQAELGMANEAIASAYYFIQTILSC